MKKLAIILLFLLVSITSFSQDYFFYNFTDKMTMNRENGYIVIKFKNNTPLSEIDRVYNEISGYSEQRIDFIQGEGNNYHNSVLVAKLKSNVSSTRSNEIESDLRIIQSVENVGMCFRYNDKVLHFTTNELIVKFKSNVSAFDIQNLNRLYKTNIVEQINSFENTYMLSIGSNSLDNVFESASKYSLTQFVEFAQPNFIRSNMLLSVKEHNSLHPLVPNDTMLPRMWHIKNTGTNIPDNIQGSPGCDMNLEQAWNITTGNPNVLIAIIDTGIDTNHTDLRPNLCDRSLWYDAYDNDQKPYDEYYHGTGVSGTSSAVGNNISGTVGVAYTCKIMPIRVFGPISQGGFTTDLILAKGLNWAWQHGSSVMNCSWGGGIPTPLITQAIRNAVNLGRNGKGAVVFGGAGNADTSLVIFPASMPEVIGVGGLGPCNQRKSKVSCDNIGGFQDWGACYGEGMEIVAPTTYIGTTELGGGWCVCGNGTSVASPLACGVGALMISKNNDISGDSVKLIIEKYAVKVGNYSYNIQKENGLWNNEMGYGKIDAKICLDNTPAGSFAGNEQVPPLINIFPPESNVSDGLVLVDADIFDNSGIASGENTPRLYYSYVNSGIKQFINGIRVASINNRYTFMLPVPPGKGVLYYVAAQDNAPVPNFMTYPPGGFGVNPPGGSSPSKMMYFKNVSSVSQNFVSSDVPINISSSSETTFVSILNNPINNIILDVNCEVNIEHTFDADLNVSLISPKGTEIVLFGGVGWDGNNFTNTILDDEAPVSIDSSTAVAPYTGIFKAVDKLWFFDGENSLGEWKLRVIDNGAADGGVLLGWNITFKYPSTSDNTNLPLAFSLVKNYPNPFNPTTRIVFNVPKMSNVKIVIYDVSGREVMTLLNEIRQPRFEDFIDFDASNLASGIYFYSLIANDEFIGSKKMVFVK